MSIKLTKEQLKTFFEAVTEVAAEFGLDEFVFGYTDERGKFGLALISPKQDPLNNDIPEVTAMTIQYQLLDMWLNATSGRASKEEIDRCIEFLSYFKKEESINKNSRFTA